ncbi:MAG: hypothetical protein A2Z20_05730 [Bdellovibrionales bacterium RBG_16_40_8]|nr:MAG: hypothetical protein A2Z20_05730 [Bdellovibrionales bacterium RBG_16_40_8]
MTKKIARERNLSHFVKDMSGVASVYQLMSLLKNEIKAFKTVENPLLAYAQSQNELHLLFYQGSKIIKKDVPGVWPQQAKIRLNNIQDSQFLANVFGRPFGKLLTIPLQLKRKSSNDQLLVSAILFFEHALVGDRLVEFTEFIGDRLQSISIVLDRLLLENDLNEAALLWEQTFDGLQDPIVIFDSEAQILRANKSFTENLQNVKSKDLFEKTLKVNNKIYEIRSYPIITGENQSPSNIINHYIDVTLAQRLKKQMIQNEKMAALGNMAGNIAHELNNPLTGIRSLAQVLIRKASPGTDIFADLHEVEMAAERCQVIIKNLLEFSSDKLENQKVLISINDIVQRTLPLLKTLIFQFELQLKLTEKNCFVLVEPHLMQQVVFNIIKNAAQAMGNSGVLTVKTEVYKKGGANEVQLIISDTGGGIDPSIRDQIFDFFFTTKSTGEGTGLGLSMSKNIVEKFAGNIIVNSELNIGSEFIITLPQAKAAVG